MNTIYKEGLAQQDQWQIIADPGSESLVDIPEGQVLIPLKVWLQQRENLLIKSGQRGVWLRGDQDPALLEKDLADLSLVAINFPVFTDGRGFSIARLLREHYGYKGELRAIGQVLRNQVDYMRQCGFDSFVCSD